MQACPGADECPDNPEVDDAAAYAVQQLSSQSNSLFPFSLKKVRCAFCLRQFDLMRSLELRQRAWLQVLSAKVARSDAGGITHHLKLQLSHGTMPDSVYEVGTARQFSGPDALENCTLLPPPRAWLPV